MVFPCISEVSARTADAIRKNSSQILSMQQTLEGAVHCQQRVCQHLSEQHFA